MKKFVKVFSVLLSLFCAVGFFGCGEKKAVGELSLYCPDGAPALSVAKLIADDDNLGAEKVSYNVVSASVISTAMTVNKADIVIIPILSATKLYNADSENPYKAVSVITHGNFYFLTSFALNSVSELKDKVVLIPQNRETVPDLTLKAILSDNGLDYAESDDVIEGKVALSYKGTGANVIGSLPVGGSGSTVAYLPEPATTNASKKKTAYSYRFDVQSAFDPESKSYPQAVVMVKKSVIDDFYYVVENLKTAMETSSAWIKENPAQAVSAIKGNFSASELPDALSVSQIEGCNIYWGDAVQEKQRIINYVNKMKGISNACANSVDDAFFI